MSYGIEQDIYIGLIRERLDDADYESDSFNTELEQIADLRMAYDEDGFPVTPALAEIDSEIIKQAEALGKFIFDEGHYDDEMKEHWAWNPGLIARGEFPPEGIPEHVRELAIELYYH